ncbi:MAG TPA: glycosyltransferase [Ignavibacteria bacterium]|nr:glycosyltransferase [Ignavibacteria bacterium]HMR39968.1 glycosyltransferase [Ignavibacteria bacterium]
MSKIKVLHISPDSVIHGTERHILSILKHSDKNEFEHSVVMPDKGNFRDELIAMNVETFIAGRKHGYEGKFDGIFGKETRDLFRIIKENKFDIVHSHLNSYGGIVAKFAGAPAIVHTRHGVFWSEEELNRISLPVRYFQKIKSDLFDTTIALGEYEKNTLKEKFNYDENKISSTINGVDVEEICAKVDRSKTKKELFGTDELIVGLVGRLEKQKGFEYLLDAVYRIKDKTDGIRFVIIGNGSMKDELISKRNSLGLEHKIIFLDYKKNILDYVNNFDFMVLTSLWEGLSYAVQEAMALGKPVIALSSPNVSGVKEIIVHDQTGYIIEEDFVNELGRHILMLSNDCIKRSQFGRASVERERDHFPEWKTASDMDLIYKRLYETKSGRK